MPRLLTWPSTTGAANCLAGLPEPGITPSGSKADPKLQVPGVSYPLGFEAQRFPSHIQLDLDLEEGSAARKEIPLRGARLLLIGRAREGFARRCVLAARTRQGSSLTLSGTRARSVERASAGRFLHR